mmetsp:Transcript_18444/g.60326  ORF Transcript_18444/g.60326 Transcript_18444/m.60326 type:complete len:355 (+) Transcript_18444:635-1699(+)
MGAAGHGVGQHHPVVGTEGRLQYLPQRAPRVPGGCPCLDVSDDAVGLEHVPPQPGIGARPSPAALLGADAAVHQRRTLSLLLLLVPVGRHHRAHLRDAVVGGEHPQGAHHPTMPAAGGQGVVHHAQQPAPARGVHCRLDGRAAVRGHLDPALHGVHHLTGADGHHVPVDARQYCLLHLRQPARAQGAAHRAPLLRYRPLHHPRLPQVHHVRPPGQVHRALHRARDHCALRLPQAGRRAILDLLVAALADGDPGRRGHRLQLPRPAAQRPLPAGAAGGGRAGRAHAPVHHYGRGEARNVLGRGARRLEGRHGPECPAKARRAADSLHHPGAQPWGYRGSQPTVKGPAGGSAGGRR